MNLNVEPTGSKELDECPCCHRATRRVWGFVHRGLSTEAAYFVQWMPGHVREEGAHFDLILGQWGEGTSASDRTAVALAFRPTDRGPEFMVIDASGRDVAGSELVATAKRRDEILGTPLAQRAFEIVDAVWLQDARIAELMRDADSEQTVGTD